MRACIKLFSTITITGENANVSLDKLVMFDYFVNFGVGFCIFLVQWNFN